MSHRIYLAGPFFKDHEVELIKLLESVLDQYELEYFSPMTHGGTLSELITDETTLEEKHQILNSIFQQNIDEINNSTLMIAIIDDRDLGTVIEIGYAIAKNIPIISFTNKNYGSNVMLSQYVLCHVKSIDELKLSLDYIVDEDYSAKAEESPEIFKEFLKLKCDLSEPSSID